MPDEAWTERTEASRIPLKVKTALAGIVIPAEDPDWVTVTGTAPVAVLETITRVAIWAARAVGVEALVTTEPMPDDFIWE